MRPAPRPLPLVSTALLSKYQRVREQTLRLVSGFAPEDLVVQSMPNASPAKWHLGHTSWFFEAMILARDPRYVPVNPQLQLIFNSYYEALGKRVARAERGLMTRPSLCEVQAYRAEIDRRMYDRLNDPLSEAEEYLFNLGLNHEQQHQELLVQDLLHLFSRNPLRPAAWREEPRTAPLALSRGGVIEISEGLVSVGHDKVDGFSFDNEIPVHRQWLNAYALSADLVSNGQWARFIEDGGYERAELWLSDGWALVQTEGLRAPAYWRSSGSGWKQFTVTGEADLDEDAPVRHINYYEADAFARWAGGRLPTEAEWEHAAATRGAEFSNLDTEVWQWTQSSYGPYPGFQPTEGTAAEYNGKFMANQMILRGGSFATPRDHLRTTYRNFYYPHQRWAFTGLRLAFDRAQNPEVACKPFVVN